ncbi:MAG: rod shape-determining protein RodA [Symbiobacteriaceae bacterium]|nr:rod shape-determining protein RodA [Symbiobacteriaceae bacterium]
MRAFHIERSMLKNMDWLLLISVVIITSIGVAMVYSASYTVVKDDPGFYLRREVIALTIATFAFLLASLLDYTVLQRFYKVIYLLMLLLLLLVFIWGEESDYGGLRWIPIGAFNLQPSELAKLFLIICMASFVDAKESQDTPQLLLRVIAILILPIIAVFKQPDLGTTTVLVVITASILFFYGVSWRWLLGITLSGLAALPMVWVYINDEQKQRIYVFLDPFNPAYGDKAAFQLLQSFVAIGSGGFWGSGYMNGSQTQLRFLPERHTDFIFSTIAEELGFVGAAFLLLVYFILIWRILSIAATSRDRFGRLVAGSVGFMLLYHLLVNVGMTLGIMPITGIPLPMVSYAASNLLSVYFALGLVVSIGLRRSKPMFP